MPIFDCFLYSNEDLILDIRLNTLDPYVKKFVIVEAAMDHQGNKKKLNFNIDNFPKFKDKISYLTIDNFPETYSSWQRENYQRNFLSKGIDDSNDEDYIMISDVDEIPNLENFHTKIKNKFTVFAQKMYYYKLNLHNTTDPVWYGTRICKKKYLKSPQWLRSQKIKKKNFFDLFKVNWNIIENGGWHFSFLLSPNEIRNKINSFAHTEFNNAKFKNLEKIKLSIKNKLDLFDRPIKYKQVKIDNTYPIYIQKNINRLKEWIL